MQDYDITLKLLLRSGARRLMHALTGTQIREWLDASLPKVQTLAADLIGKAVDGRIIHLELQSTNHPGMPFRMLAYYVAIYQTFGQFPVQIVLYVGEAPLSMPSELRGPDLWLQYRMVDIRDMV